MYISGLVNDKLGQLMKKFKKMGKRRSKKLFRKTSSKAHAFNRPHVRHMRGGVRL